MADFFGRQSSPELTSNAESQSSSPTPLYRGDIYQHPNMKSRKPVEMHQQVPSQVSTTFAAINATAKQQEAVGATTNAIASTRTLIPKQELNSQQMGKLPVTPAFRSSAPREQRKREDIQAPSALSGGVPEPSLVYLSRSKLEPQASREPQNILLVIDLNGTILFRPDRSRSTHFIERPLAQLFLDYVVAQFYVMIWSSARPQNVARMCTVLFKMNARKQLVAEWGRDRFGLTQNDYDKRVQVYKRLEMVWADEGVQRRHPRHSLGETWNQTNTVLIDDSSEKARSEPHNLVEISEFTNVREPPDILPQLAEYLEILKMQTNVSSYIRQHPFKVLASSNGSTGESKTM